MLLIRRLNNSENSDPQSLAVCLTSHSYGAAMHAPVVVDMDYLS
jgi:hypothetical protein